MGTRTLLTCSLVILTVAAQVGGWSAAAAQPLLEPLSQPKFVNPLPIAARLDATGGGSYTIGMTEFEQHLGLVDPVTLAPLMTTVWGYGGSYPGPTFVARKDVPVNVRWTNDLTLGGQPLSHLLPVDTTVHWATPEGWPESGVPAVVHLHGGHTESASDGLPDAWFTPGFGQTGHGFVKETLTYHNDQEAGTLWYHDHALGITRLNVYAGLAGFYLLRDENEDALVAAHNMPTGPYEIEMAIQDRMFTADGQLFYPAMAPAPGQPDPSVMPEFFGDVILVNGKSWPILEVEPRQYRLRTLNGSDSRFYNMWLAEKFEDVGARPGPATGVAPLIYQVGTDDGFLQAPVMLTQVTLGPGERADLVVDFSDPALWGKSFVLRNNARSPFPKGAPVDPRTTGQIMAFSVTKPLDTSVFPATALPVDLRPVHGAIESLTPTPGVPARDLVLFEGVDEFGRLKPMLGTTQDGALQWHDDITENPMVGDTEIWTVYNATADAHPVHLHLVSFQIVDRQAYKADVDPVTGAHTNIRLVGKPKPPAPEERGWKDTARMLPGEVTRVIAKFDREGLYVWHCHILSHEDHEMMRPYYVGVMPPMMTALQSGPSNGLAVSAGPVVPSVLGLGQNYPNPFNPTTFINFQLPSAADVDLRVYNVQGQEVRLLARGAYPAGRHSVVWDGRGDSGDLVPSGVYFYELKSGDLAFRKKMVMIR